MSGLLMAGNLTLDRYVNGSPSTAFHGPLNAKKVSINPGEAERIKRKSYGRDTYGQTLDSAVLPGSPSLSIELDDCTGEALAYALLGDTSSVSQAGGTVAGESVTIYALDKWHKLGAHQISSVTVRGKTATSVTAATISFTAPDIIADSGNGLGGFATGNKIAILGSDDNDGVYTVDTAAAGQLTLIEQTITTGSAGDSITIVKLETLTVGTDYALDLETGMVKALTGGTIAAAEQIFVGYTKAATTATRIKGNQQTDITCQVRLDGTNLATGKACSLVAYKVVMVPSGELNLIGDEFVSFSLEGDLVTPDGYGEAYYYDEFA